MWHLPKEHSKTDVGFTISLPPEVLKWLEELKIRGFGSDLTEGLVNALTWAQTRSIEQLISYFKTKQPPNLMGDMPHFTVHDLRRTCRTLLAKQGKPGHVAERCLNHKLKGIEGIYDQYDYLEERKGALKILSATLFNLF